MWKFAFVCLLVLEVMGVVKDAHSEALRVGYIGSLSGDSGALGREILRSLEVIVDRVNKAGGLLGRRVELVIADDRYHIVSALNAYEQMKGELNSHVLFMSTYGALFALGNKPVRDDLLIVDTLDCNDQLVAVSAMHTCIATRTESIVDSLMEVIERKKKGAIGILYEDEAWFNFLVSRFQSKAKERVIAVATPRQAASYHTELLVLRKQQVQHIVFLGNDSMGRAMLQARQQGMNGQFYSIAGVMSPGFQVLAGDALNGAIISNWAAPNNQLLKNFEQDFKRLHNTNVQFHSFAAPTADAATLVFGAISTLLPQGLSGKALRHKLPEEDSISGISGRITMEPDGAVRSILERAYQFNDGVLQEMR